MKHFRILFPLLILALVLSACGERPSEPYTYTFHTDSAEKTVTVYPESGQIVDGLDVYTYTVEESGSGTNYVITYPNGNRFKWTETKNGGHGGWSAGSDNVRYISGTMLVYALEAGQPRERSGNIGLGLLLMGLGVVDFLFPEVMFHLRRGWMFRNAEPSDAYLLWGKIGGVLVAVLGLILCII